MAPTIAKRDRYVCTDDGSAISDLRTSTLKSAALLVALFINRGYEPYVAQPETIVYLQPVALPLRQLLW